MQLLPTQRRLKKTILLLVAANALAGLLSAETCTTQSEMKPAERDAIATTARTLATLIQANDTATLRQQTLPEYTKDFSGMSSLVGNTAPKIKGASLQVDQVYILDASTLKTLGDGTNQDAQFFCSLNRSMAEANFLIPALPPGRYAFAIVTAANISAPWHLSFLLKHGVPTASQNGVQNNVTWIMAGLYPKPLTAAGRDGIWYWTNARNLAKSKQLWNAYLYYQQAQALLQPAGFVTSTHLDKLRKEAANAAPPSLSDGISADAPLVVKNPNGKSPNATDYRFTDLTTDDSFGATEIDIVAHLAPDPLPDTSSNVAKPNPKAPATPVISPHDRNSSAMSALLAAYPELRNSFHGVWIFADTPGKSPFVTESPMADIH